MKFETILCDVKDEILTITLNRPDRLNAWNTQMLYDLIAAFDHADENDDGCHRPLNDTAEGQHLFHGDRLSQSGPEGNDWGQGECHEAVTL